MENRKTKYDIIYALMFLFSAIMVIILFCQYKGQDTATTFFSQSANYEYEQGWHTSDGKSVNLRKLNHVSGTKAGEEYSIYNTLPDTIQEGDALCFRSKNIFFQVYIDGTLQYEPYVQDSPLYTKSYGTNWSYVHIPAAAAGKEVELRITYVYNSGRTCIDHVCITQPASAVLGTIHDKFVALITCILLLFVGILVIVADIPITMGGAKKNHELRYLGFFSISIAIWCLSETNLLQLFIGDSRVMQVVSCSSLMLIPMPIIFYLDSAFGFRQKFWVPIISAMSVVQFILCWGLHLAGIADIHETLFATHFVLAVTAVILLCTIIRNYISANREGKKEDKRNVYRILRTIGLGFISVATAADLYRYYQGNSTDTAMFVRIGILVFIICFGSSSLEQTINAVKLGVKSEFVAQLAYQDGLTQIGNRTSFEEHLVDLEKIKDHLPAIGIVMFDVNDLKYVNDNMGHHSGDDMLVKSAEIIRASFLGADGDCFRIGGDEFAVLLRGEHVEKRYADSIALFLEKVKQHNALPDKSFRISIAHGFATYSKDCQGTKLMDIYQQADREMYNNKKAMKASQMPPAEYYRLNAMGKR